VNYDPGHDEAFLVKGSAQPPTCTRNYVPYMHDLVKGAEDPWRYDALNGCTKYFEKHVRGLSTPGFFNTPKTSVCDAPGGGG